MLRDIVTSTKSSAIVAGVTTTSGVNTWLKIVDWIPDDIGKIATCLGIILTCIMIPATIAKWRLDVANKRLAEIKTNDILARQQLAEAQDKIRQLEKDAETNQR